MSRPRATIRSRSKPRPRRVRIGRRRLEPARPRARRARLHGRRASRWRNRAEFSAGPRGDRGLPRRANGQRELDYRLIKEVWAFRENRIAVRFAYEWHDDSGSWFRSYGNENWEFDEHGLMRVRIASINDLPIKRERAQVSLAARPPARRSPVA